MKNLILKFNKILYPTAAKGITPSSIAEWRAALFVILCYPISSCSLLDRQGKEIYLQYCQLNLRAKMLLLNKREFNHSFKTLMVTAFFQLRISQFLDFQLLPQISSCFHLLLCYNNQKGKKKIQRQQINRDKNLSATSQYDRLNIKLDFFITLHDL